MLYFILIVAVIALFALWRIEAGECEDVRCSAQRYIAERDEETRLRLKAEREVNTLCHENDVLERRCEELQHKCDALSHERICKSNEMDELRKCTVEYAFSDWERREVDDIPGMVEYGRDGIVLIYECGKMVGWRAADTVQVRFKRPKRKTKTPKQSTYEAPSAEVVEKEEENNAET
jgi:hypothetical protein